MERKIVIVVHGGAWNIPHSLIGPSITGVEEAAKVGWEILENEGTALDSVEAAVMSLEDNPVFDAGIGSALTKDGQIEMDAMIMEGRTLRAGAVAGVSNIKNPVHLARLVMENTEHVMLIGTGAMKFAKNVGIPLVSRDTLLTEDALKTWKEFNMFKKTINTFFSTPDTVGAVALDWEGNVAAATSTGGITGKMSGRVGDSPIIGSGGYADNLIGAASSTGHGEAIMKITLARHALFYLTRQVTPKEAALNSLKDMKERVNGHGGIILIDNTGSFTAQFTTEKMAWAAITDGKLQSGCKKPSS